MDMTRSNPPAATVGDEPSADAANSNMPIKENRAQRRRRERMEKAKRRKEQKTLTANKQREHIPYAYESEDERSFTPNEIRSALTKVTVIPEECKEATEALYSITRQMFDEEHFNYMLDGYSEDTINQLIYEVTDAVLAEYLERKHDIDLEDDMDWWEKIVLAQLAIQLGLDDLPEAKAIDWLAIVYVPRLSRARKELKKIWGITKNVPRHPLAQEALKKFHTEIFNITLHKFERKDGQSDLEEWGIGNANPAEIALGVANKGIEVPNCLEILVASYCPERTMRWWEKMIDQHLSDLAEKAGPTQKTRRETDPKGQPKVATPKETSPNHSTEALASGEGILSSKCTDLKGKGRAVEQPEQPTDLLTVAQESIWKTRQEGRSEEAQYAEAGSSTLRCSKTRQTNPEKTTACTKKKTVGCECFPDQKIVKHDCKAITKLLEFCETERVRNQNLPALKKSSRGYTLSDADKNQLKLTLLDTRLNAIPYLRNTIRGCPRLFSMKQEPETGASWFQDYVWSLIFTGTSCALGDYDPNFQPSVQEKNRWFEWAAAVENGQEKNIKKLPVIFQKMIGIFPITIAHLGKNATKATSAAPTVGEGVSSASGQTPAQVHMIEPRSSDSPPTNSKTRSRRSRKTGNKSSQVPPAHLVTTLMPETETTGVMEEVDEVEEEEKKTTMIMTTAATKKKRKKKTKKGKKEEKAGEALPEDAEKMPPEKSSAPAVPSAFRTEFEALEKVANSTLGLANNLQSAMREALAAISSTADSDEDEEE